jgi:hypothetical protein
LVSLALLLGSDKLKEDRNDLAVAA